MPVNTKVHRCYAKVKKKKSKGAAARICQSKTGQALATGKPPKRKRKTKRKY